MPGIRDPRFDWLKPENESVFDSYWIKLARKLARLAGAGDPQSEVMMMPGAAIEAPVARELKVLSALTRGTKASTAGAALDMTEAARLARATEQGYTIDALHGRSGAYDAVAIPSWKRSADAGATGEGFYATPAGERGGDVASYYAGQAGPAENVMPLKLKLERPLRIASAGVDDPRPAAMARLSKEWGLKEQPRFSGSKQLNAAWATEFSDALRARGFDGVETDLGFTKEYMVLSPEQVRSRFAQFDPNKIGSKDLVASITGGVGLSDVARPRKKESAR